MATGFFLVAYPNDGLATDFEFSYGLVGYHSPPAPVVIIDNTPTKTAEEIMLE
jgi:hypothetical protein